MILHIIIKIIILLLISFIKFKIISGSISNNFFWTFFRSSSFSSLLQFQLLWRFSSVFDSFFYLVFFTLARLFKCFSFCTKGNNSDLDHYVKSSWKCPPLHNHVMWLCIAQHNTFDSHLQFGQEMRRMSSSLSNPII